MNYKEALFFIGKCLTVSQEEHNKILVEEHLKKTFIDWESIVKISTSHYVFPALYCNLKYTNFLSYLPSDLVEYMKYITDLNRERNQQIIQQAKEINELLLSYNITPVFLKGTGNLLEGLYNDIAERMVGDIDFLVNSDEFEKSIVILKEFGYFENLKSSNPFPLFKHFYKLQKDKRISSVEIHKEMTEEKYANLFNYKSVISNIYQENNITCLGFEDQIKLSIIAVQINDDGQFFNNISLRNAYDVFLLSNKVNSIKSIDKLSNKLFYPLNNFLASAKITLNSKSINYIQNKKSDIHINIFLRLIDDKKYRKKFNKKRKRKVSVSSKISTILKAFYKREYAIWLLKRLIRKISFKSEQ